VACTNYSLVNDAGKIIYKEHANTSRLKAVPPLKSISKKLSDPEVRVKYK
jgi:hypothetical protein